MPRPRVLSFMSQWKDGPPRSPNNSAPSSPTVGTPERQEYRVPDSPNTSSPAPPRKNSIREHDKPPSRPSSMIQSYQPPVMEIAQDTLPELQPIFSFLNNHSNKLYQEGYFLKLHDLDGRGRPSVDRVWVECFAQLVGTVLSLWDAAELDAAGEDGEVIPTFINLTDASIKMIESLPMNSSGGQSLQNVLSVSTAANNRYLFHFNSLHSLTQWTSGIRLAMYEHTTLQEAYTGSIIAGKGKHLNGIKSIMERTRFPTEDWARVRFGVGTPWRRLWCVITPPDEKEFQKAQKTAKKRSAYDRPPVVKGTIKFYENRKVTKKSFPIATMKDAHAAYAIYPQSKALIEQSTLVKVEGIIQVHTNPESTTEGFLFVMPEVHPMVSGFEIMLRWLMPLYDTFALYGRPNRLVADVLDTRSLMFAMPTQQRTGFLELIDVAGLIHTEGSSRWTEKEWRKQMKILTSKRMTNASSTPSRADTESTDHRRTPSRSSLNLPSSRGSFNPPSRNGIKFGGEGVPSSSPASRVHSPPASHGGSPRLGPEGGMFQPPVSPYASPARHQRAVSDQPPPIRNNYSGRPSTEQARYEEPTPAPPPPPHGASASPYLAPHQEHYHEKEAPYQDRAPPSPEPNYPQQNGYSQPPIENVIPNQQPFAPVEAPPVMSHRGSQLPPVRPNQMPEMRRANSAIDEATLAQLRDANRPQNDGPPPTLRDDHVLPTERGGPPPAPRHNWATQAPSNGGGPAMSNFGGMLPNQGGPPMNNFGGVFPNQGGPFPNFASMSQQTPLQNRGAPHNFSGERRLPTIPGTPAVEDNNQFDVVVEQQRGTLQREASTGNIPRKPVPGK